METPKNCPHCNKPLGANSVEGLCPDCLLRAGLDTGAKGTTGVVTGRMSGAMRFVPPPAAELQKLFPQLEIVELIGQGGMGAVYKARQPALDRLVALKILPPETANEPGFADRFTREARAMARLSHPNIVAVHDFGRSPGGADGGFPYFVMEYVDGANLRTIEQAGKLAAREALGIIPQICTALQFAHDAGIVHRDIKPENILVDKEGRVKIADFGIAKVFGRDATGAPLTAGPQVLGTPHYMAPEQVERPRQVDHRADIYSLGVVFYEMLTGELPLGRFSVPSRKAATDPRLDEVVMRTLEKEPHERYQHASEVKTAVDHIANSRAQTGSVPSVTPVKTMPAGRFLTPGRMRKLVTVFGLVFAGILAGFVVYSQTVTPVYFAEASVQVLREERDMMAGGADAAERTISPEDFNTRVRVMESQTMVNAVADRLQSRYPERFPTPSRSNPNDATTQLRQWLAAGRVVNPVRLTAIIQVGFVDTNQATAALVANTFAEAFIDYNKGQAADASIKVVKDLAEQSTMQRNRIEDIQSRMAKLLNDNSLAALNGGANFVAAALQQQSQLVNDDKRALDVLEAPRRQVTAQMRAGKPMWEVPFLARNPPLDALIKQSANLKLELASLAPQYAASHPRVIDLNAQKEALEKQLEDAGDAAAKVFMAEYETAETNLDQATKRMDVMLSENKELSKVRLDYDTLQRDLEVASAIYKQIEMAKQQEGTRFALITPTYRVVDLATVPERPVERSLPFLRFMGIMTGAEGSFLKVVIGVGGGLLAMVVVGMVMWMRAGRQKVG